MIKTTRSRLEIRQEPDAASSLAGALIVAFGAMEVLTCVWLMAKAQLLSAPLNVPVHVLRAVLGATFFVAGWFFLRQRSRVVFDLDHRMVLQYIGVGGQRFDGNESHDLADFSAVVLTRQEQRGVLRRGLLRADVVCLRRRDGTDLEVYWAGSGRDASDTARRVADFVSLPYLGRGAL